MLMVQAEEAAEEETMSSILTAGTGWGHLQSSEPSRNVSTQQLEIQRS
jgi:hypothetical protein